MTDSYKYKNANFKLKNYETLIFDCDGVILDSNKIKEQNINTVSSKYLEETKLKEFINFFNSNPGVPREIKIQKFIKDRPILSEILKDYNKLNLISLKNAPIVAGFKDYITSIMNLKINKYVVSGGDQDELLEVLDFKGLSKYFNFVLGGPNTKYQNVDKLKINNKTLYFGDSQLDYEVCEHYYFDFVYVKGYTDRELVFKYKSSIRKYVINNFNDIKQ
jgi:phosphoglycolate phosphatase-like HAD superfamily hydrolase